MISGKELFAEISNAQVAEGTEVVGYFVRNSRMELLENLLTNPPASSAPDVALDNFKEAMQGIGHIRRTIEETFGGLHGTHFEPDVLLECKQICDAIYSAYRPAAPSPGGE